MSGQPYKKPPITEAVVEVRFATPMDAADLQKVSSDFNLDYPVHQIVRNFGVQVEMPITIDNQPTARVNQQVIGHRRASSDLSEIVLILPSSFAMSQLAPYPGWDIFFKRFNRDWASWKKALGYRKISRVGVRFINRIDIPFSGGRVIEESEYLNVYPRLPDIFGPVAAYSVQTQAPVGEIGCNLTINSSSIPSPLLDHVSLILDIDIARDAYIPQKDEDIYKLLDAIRVRKNQVFEDCVTDKARELFQPWLA